MYDIIERPVDTVYRPIIAQYSGRYVIRVECSLFHFVEKYSAEKKFGETNLSTLQRNQLPGSVARPAAGQC